MVHSNSYKFYPKFMLRTMAFEQSSEKESINTAERHSDCSRHDCDTACGIDGYCGAQGDGYYSSAEGPLKSKDQPKFRHDKSRCYL